MRGTTHRRFHRVVPQCSICRSMFRYRSRLGSDNRRKVARKKASIAEARAKIDNGRFNQVVAMPSSARGHERLHREAVDPKSLRPARLAIHERQHAEDFAASSRIASIALSAEPPDVITSSITTTRLPCAKFPSIRRPVPCVFASLRTEKASIGAPARMLAAAIA